MKLKLSVLFESLIFSAEEPLSKESIKKMLFNYGNFDIEKILNDLKDDYCERGVVLIELEKNTFSEHL